MGVPISISHQVLPEYREYERTSTVVVNAYLQPLMGRYLTLTLRTRICLHSTRSLKMLKTLRVMQSSGGSISAQVAAHEPVRTILSGPAGGVVGALRVARRPEFENIITFDMGGTSTDVALCDREGMRLTNESMVAGIPVAMPMMDIHTVGAGGGSIARLDEGGSLRVGPESPAPIPAQLVTGDHLADGHRCARGVGSFSRGGLLGGEFKLDAARAHQALTQLASQMSAAAKRKVSSTEAAQGVLREFVIATRVTERNT